jgi:UPF0755 protein
VKKSKLVKILALDVGEKRIGVAWGDSEVKIPTPLTTVDVKAGVFDVIKNLAQQLPATLIVVGLPRGQSGQTTRQSDFSRAFAKTLSNYVKMPILFQDESLTSVVAENRLKKRGKKYQKADIDKEAAAVILGDFLNRPQLAEIVEKAASASARDNLKKSVSARGDQSRTSNQDLTKPAVAVSAGSEVADKAGSKIITKPDSKNLARAAKKSLEKLDKKSVEAKAKTPPPTAKVEEIIKKKKRRKIGRRKWIISVGAALVVLLIAAGVWFNSMLGAVAPGNKGTVTVSIPKGRTLRQTADILKSQGLIKTPIAYLIYAKIYGTSVQAGKHTLSPSQTVPEIARQLETAESNEIAVEIPPGQTLKQLRTTFEKVGFSDVEIDAALSPKNYDSPILSDLPSGASLEGYIFPDTYNIYVDDSLKTLIQKAIDEMNAKIVQGGLAAKFKAHNLTVYQGITLASIVQQEAGNATDQYKIAGVFYNRLAQNMALGSDVTYMYAYNQGLCSTNGPSCDSTYNTRIHSGLPPGPISNMNYSALEAVADPTASDNLYFVAGDDGTIHYSTTEQQHEQNVQNYCTKLCQ